MTDWLKLGGDLLDKIPLDKIVDYSKGLFSDDDAKDSMKNLTGIFKDKDLRSDLKEIGVDVETAGRRINTTESFEFMSTLAESLLDADKLDDSILDDDEKFETSVAALKAGLSDKETAAFDKLTEEQQEAFIVLVATPEKEVRQAIQEAAEESRTADPQASLGNDNASFADTMDDQQVAQNGDIDVDWNESAAQLSDNFADNAGTPYVEPVEPAPAVEVDNTFKV
ncbi:MAG: hypothetical protein COB36_04370 [Alphaproteobacteria bacterium]|nr:MAG: hypothetical protein COB36_04370 [Alphaproteobacteria bacterium]